MHNNIHFIGVYGMKKISYFGLLAAMMMAMPAFANTADKFRGEVARGLDLISATVNVDVVADDAPGELGADVYRTVGAVDADDIRMFVPTSMYVRMGGGINLGFATDSVTVNGTTHDASGGWSTQIGLGWNLSSYVRTEIDFQETTLKFSGLDNRRADYKTLGASLYFDLARRYVMTGDVTHRRTFVPFIGVGAAVGAYEFQGAGGADGFVVVAPRAVAGFNIMFNDLIGVDIMYQYQMMIGNGFGWGVMPGGVDNVSNVMASFRVNF